MGPFAIETTLVVMAALPLPLRAVLRLQATRPEDLDQISGEIHDWFFDVDDVEFTRIDPRWSSLSGAGRETKPEWLIRARVSSGSSS